MDEARRGQIVVGKISGNGEIGRGLGIGSRTGAAEKGSDKRLDRPCTDTGLGQQGNGFSYGGQPEGPKELAGLDPDLWFGRMHTRSM